MPILMEFCWLMHPLGEWIHLVDVTLGVVAYEIPLVRYIARKGSVVMKIVWETAYPIGIFLADGFRKCMGPYVGA